ncbi:MAG: winged helix DNA-binding domain-containing protein, partial [Actinomycetes bacterium]|nr:winged helix DNA-binding domain-containing protein [Actinomycetes bacterium]MDX5379942.1 winged helix DNA-binding domain-containing protein [Actinomycetes bacterium]MDX5398449.1 winged helix DNA-binding domain-containing protein [Actinomycetes bacterium]MDX5449654.1 winged helix DNA-binding domain-containing protein [Actinomycetes bacterium]
MRETLSAAEARRETLGAQGLARPERPDTPGTRHLQSVMRRLGLIQIDSVNVFARAHHMPFFSRLGPYDPAGVDRLSLGHRSPWTEYAAHENSVIPAADWALWRFRMTERRERYADWLAANAATVDWVRTELATRGPLRPAEIETDAHRAAKGPW